MSTRKFATTESPRVSMTETVLLVSAVTYTQRPSGLIPTPSGSMPTMSVARTRFVRKSMADAVPASSFAA
jgi:hypothetical protein